MKTDHQLINFIPLIIYMLNEMVLKNDLLFQKSVRYKHHKKNYLKSLEERIVPRGLKLRKESALTPVSEDF